MAVLVFVTSSGARSPSPPLLRTRQRAEPAQDPGPATQTIKNERSESFPAIPGHDTEAGPEPERPQKANAGGNWMSAIACFEILNLKKSREARAGSRPRNANNQKRTI